MKMIITFHQTLIVILVVVIGSTSSWSTLTLAEPRRLLEESAAAKKKHESWASSKGKVYASAAEKEKRGKIFKTNLDFIEKFNANPKRSFKLKANKFADQSKDEFHKSRTGGFTMMNLTREVTSATMSFPAGYKTLDTGDYSTASSSIPSQLDWRKSNAVNPIRNQGECGSCWAFATVATVESATYIKTGKLPQLSEQQLVDCARGTYTHGCSSGNHDEAYAYIHNNKGIASRSNYPYKAKTGSCSGTAHGSAAHVTGYVDVPANDEEALRYAVARQPVAAFVDSRGDEFMFYGGGLYDAPCGTTLDHVMTVVGYGKTAEGVPYWLLRNSWGTDWGEDGYMRLLRNAGPPEGHCGIAMYNAYPVV